MLDNSWPLTFLQRRWGITECTSPLLKALVLTTSVLLDADEWQQSVSLKPDAFWNCPAPFLEVCGPSHTLQAASSGS